MGFKTSVKSFRVDRMSRWYYPKSNLLRKKTEDKHFKELKEGMHC